MAEHDLLLFQRLRDFDRRKRANIAVIVAAHGNRIDMRADQKRLERRIRAGACADDVSGGVDVNVEPGFFHQGNGIIAALEIGVRVGHPADAALRVGAEL